MSKKNGSPGAIKDRTGLGGGRERESERRVVERKANQGKDGRWQARRRLGLKRERGWMQDAGSRCRRDPVGSCAPAARSSRQAVKRSSARARAVDSEFRPLTAGAMRAVLAALGAMATRRKGTERAQCARCPDVLQEPSSKRLAGQDGQSATRVDGPQMIN